MQGARGDLEEMPRCDSSRSSGRSRGDASMRFVKAKTVFGLSRRGGTTSAHLYRRGAAGRRGRGFFPRCVIDGGRCESLEASPIAMKMLPVRYASCRATRWRTPGCWKWNTRQRPRHASTCRPGRLCLWNVFPFRNSPILTRLFHLTPIPSMLHGPVTSLSLRPARIRYESVASRKHITYSVCAVSSVEDSQLTHFRNTP